MKNYEIVIANGKGGAGKTTVTYLLALAFAEAGHHVALRDLDPQLSITQAASLPPFASHPRIGLLPHAPAGANITLTDSPARLESKNWQVMLRKATLIVIVSQPFIIDLWAARDAFSMINRGLPEIPIALLGNQIVPAHTYSRIFPDSVKQLALSPCHVLRQTLSRRENYRHAINGGWSVLDASEKNELLLIASELLALCQNACQK